MNFVSKQYQTISSQRVRIEELEETIRQMRESLAPGVRFPIQWRLTASQQGALAAFSRAPKGFLSHEQIFIAMGSKAEEADNLVKVQIAKLRKKIEPFGVKILKRWGVGYELTPESLKIVKSAAE